MKGKKFITWVFALIMLAAGFLSAMEVAAGEIQKAPILKALKIRKYVGFPDDKEAKASYDVDPETGCIQNFFDKDGNPIEPTRPGWLVESKETSYFGNLNESQCQQGVLGIGSCPVEYWSYANGHYFCVFAWDYINYRFYQPCRATYPSCY